MNVGHFRCRPSEHAWAQMLSGEPRDRKNRWRRGEGPPCAAREQPRRSGPRTTGDGPVVTRRGGPDGPSGAGAQRARPPTMIGVEVDRVARS